MKIATIKNAVAICLTPNEIVEIMKNKKIYNKEEFQSFIVLTTLITYFKDDSEDIASAGLVTFSDKNGLTFIITNGNVSQKTINKFTWEKTEFTEINANEFFVVPDEVINSFISLDSIDSEDDDDDFDYEDEDNEYQCDSLILDDDYSENIVFEANRLSDLAVYKNLIVLGVFEYKNKYYLVAKGTYQIHDYDNVSLMSEEELMKYGKLIVKFNQIEKFFEVL